MELRALFELCEAGYRVSCFQKFEVWIHPISFEWIWPRGMDAFQRVSLALYHAPSERDLTVCHQFDRLKNNLKSKPSRRSLETNRLKSDGESSYASTEFRTVTRNFSDFALSRFASLAFGCLPVSMRSDDFMLCHAELFLSVFKFTLQTFERVFAVGKTSGIDRRDNVYHARTHALSTSFGATLRQLNCLTDFSWLRSAPLANSKVNLILRCKLLRTTRPRATRGVTIIVRQRHDRMWIELML